MTARTVYSYDSVTGEYTGASTADENPEEPGSVLMPAFATGVMPPNAPAGMACFWRNGQWETLSVSAPVPTVQEYDTPEAKQQRAVNLVQAMLDTAARDLGYDSITTAVTYADEPAVPKFQLEGQRLRRLRSMSWAECYTILGEVEASGDWPTEEEFMARMPTYAEMEQWEVAAVPDRPRMK